MGGRYGIVFTIEEGLNKPRPIVIKLMLEKMIGLRSKVKCANECNEINVERTRDYVQQRDCGTFFGI